MNTNLARRTCLQLLGAQALTCAALPASAQNSFDLPRPRGLGELMRPTPWHQYEPEEVFVNVKTDDHAGFFSTRQGPNAGGRFSVVDPLVLSGEVKFQQPFPRTYAYYRERWVPVQSFTVQGPDSHEKEVRTTVGSRTEEIQEFNRSISMDAKFGSAANSIGVSARLSEMARRTAELTQSREVKERFTFTAQQGEVALYVLWQRQESLRILTREGQSISYQSLWTLSRGGRVTNQAIATFVSPNLENLSDQLRNVKTSFRA